MQLFFKALLNETNLKLLVDKSNKVKYASPDILYTLFFFI